MKNDDDTIIYKKDFIVSDADLYKRKRRVKKTKLTKEQIELGATYLAMSNMCTLDPFRKNIKDLPSLKQAVHQAWESAVTGIMEGQKGGYDDRHEVKACRAVEAEVKSFRSDLKAGGKRAAYWLEVLTREVPFLFNWPGLRWQL